MDIEKEREAFLYELDGHGYSFQDMSFIETKFNDDVLNMVWELWLAAKDDEEKKLEGCVESSVWVATDFLLPDEGELVLFIDNHNVIHEGFISTDYVDGPYGENGEDLGGNKTLWSSNSNGWELLPEEVKYWMKRPNNPVEAVRGGNE